MKNEIEERLRKVKMTTHEWISAAHFVHTDKDSPCNRLHGHNWLIEVEIMGTVAKDGMIIDKSSVKEVIMQLDHKLIIPESLIEEEGKQNIEIRNGEKKYSLPKDDVLILSEIKELVITSENMAILLSDRISNLKENIEQVSVEVHESNKLSATANTYVEEKMII